MEEAMTTGSGGDDSGANLEEDKQTNSEFPDIDKIFNLWDFKNVSKWSMKKKEIALAACLLLVLGACVILAVMLASKINSIQQDSDIYESTCITIPCLESASYVTRNMNKSVDPCTNFYRYACDAFPKFNPVNSRRGERTVFTNLRDKNREKIADILSAPIKRRGRSSSEQKVKYIFRSCTDTFRRNNARGTPVLTRVIPQLGGWYVTGSFNSTYWNFKDALKNAMINFNSQPFYTFRVAVNWYNTNNKILEIHFTSRYWHYKETAHTPKFHDNLTSLIRKMGSYLLRDSNIQLNEETKSERLNNFVNDAFYMESMLTNISKNTRKIWRDPHLEENKETIKGLDDKTRNNLNFTDILMTWFPEGGITKYTKVAVFNEPSLEEIASLIENLGANKSRILNNFLVWRIIYDFSWHLSWDYQHASTGFHLDLFGRPHYFSNTKRYCEYMMRRHLRDALGSLFIKDTIVEESKTKVTEIVKYVKDALAPTKENKIFDEETRAAARKKLMASVDQLGYPDFMMDDNQMDSRYSGLKVRWGDYFFNVLSMINYTRNESVTNYQSEVDKSKWNHRVYSTSMYHNDYLNLLFVPAGILQFPFYDYTLPHFMNFGSIGSSVGMYMAWAFDHIGARHQSDGSLRNWWNNHTQDRWDESVACVGEYYSTKTMGPFNLPSLDDKNTVKVDGKSFAPIAIVETSGVRVAYKAYHQWVKENREEKRIPGLELTNDQTFFLAFAQKNCYVRTDEAAYRKIAWWFVSEDIRTNGVLAQLPEFSKAFNCPVDSPMNARKKCNFF